MDVKISYIFHSCFVLENNEVAVVYDYWKDTPDGKLRNLLEHTDKQIYFVVSHFHEDHFNPQIFEWKDMQLASGKKPRYLISYDTMKRRRIEKTLPDCILRFDEVYHDEYLKLTSFHSTDVGVSTITELPDGTTAYHAGDNNNWYFEQGEEHLKVSANEMEGLYLSILRDIRKIYPSVDHAMIPVDPRLDKQTLRGPQQWLFYIQTKHCYPMHIWEDTEATKINIEQLQEMFPTTRFHYEGQR